MKTQNKIFEFVKEISGENVIAESTDIFADFGVTGDDFHELMDIYAELFNVDMSKYLWYFHCDEEGHSFGSWIFKTPYERVDRIPVTPKMLHKFAEIGEWKIEYPKHKLPKRRYDLIINVLFIASASFFLIYKITTWVINKIL